MNAEEAQAPPCNGETDQATIDAFIGRWHRSGGAESANFQTFANELCDLLSVPRPDPAQEQVERNDYVFERRVGFKHEDGSTTPGRVDLYKRDCFVMEAKQSAKRLKAKKIDPERPELIPEDATQISAGTATRGTRRWDKVMRAAKRQAEDYARALPKEHGWPPFILVVDVGHVIEVYADFSGQGKNYAQFPDREGYSIPLEGLHDQTIRDRLQAIWRAPHSLDPARRSAEVTRDIAERLAHIAHSLEGKHDPKEVAEFLMRCLFTMFAEDVGLLPKQGFEDLLGKMVGTPRNFAPALESLWQVMDEGGYAPHLNAMIKRFNGTLFRNRKAIALEKKNIHELHAAASRDWRDVEPAIFGTLLERALDKRERSKLGAHYTPRAYVERLVVPTIIEPLRADWEEALTRAHALEGEGKHQAALQAIKDFHHQLCATRVLDPACGTGNFLYVSLELMKRLEGEVLEVLDALGEPDLAPRLAMEGETVSPRQFHGLEINPRAVAIADLVLWIGYLKWQLRTVKAEDIAEPVLHAYGTIKEQDAILAWDKQELLRDEHGVPLSHWDGVTTKLHPITGEEVPDPDATVELYRYENPRPTVWPEAEFIVGNPPFIGNKRMRTRLGSSYVDALHHTHRTFGGSVDYVMYWWVKASHQLGVSCRRFGLVTTNSISQSLNRKLMANELYGDQSRSIIFAIADHPWIDEKDGAAVRVAMTVVELSEQDGRLLTLSGNSELELSTPTEKHGPISDRLRIGTRIAAAKPLIQNRSLSYMGVILVGSGFVLSEEKLSALGYTTNNLPSVIKPYQNGRELAAGARNRFVIDFFGIELETIQEIYPRLYQVVLNEVKPFRDNVRRENHRRYWWIFGEARPALREASLSIEFRIGTSETSKHRVFQILEDGVLPDQKIRIIAIDDFAVLSILSSRVHCIWSEVSGGRQGAGNDLVYNNTVCFDPFPFELQGFDSKPSSKHSLKSLGRRLDSFRKARLAEHDFLTITALYNVLERVRELENGCDVPPLSAKEKDIHEAGLVSVLKEIHDEIDSAVFEAYGWADLIPALVGKPGATMPSPHKSPEQEEAEEELLARLVALNQRRAAEEGRGIVHWLRPDYQIPKLGHKVKTSDDVEQLEAQLIVPAPADGKPAWPRDEMDRIRVVREMLSRTRAPVAAKTLSVAFRGKNSVGRMKGVKKALQTLIAAGVAQQEIVGQDGSSRYFIPR